VIGFPATPRQIDRTAPLVALLLVATVTEAMFLLLPSFVGALGDVLQLSATRTGLLASADLTGIALTTATAPWWLRRVSWRRTALASLLAFLLVNLLCFAVRSFWPLLCLRVLAGLTPSGTETVLHSFAGGFSDGENPAASLIQGSDGNLYGTTLDGGLSSVGTVFKVALQ
jgi:uncharacterized repeat protein (TIGR03803 family)